MATSLLEKIRIASQALEDGDVELEIYDHNPKDPDQIRWMAGALDALIGGNGDTQNQTKARAMNAALGNLVRRPGPATFSHLYELIKDVEAIGVVDGFISKVKQSRLDREAVADIARVIATGAPSLPALKIAIALLGMRSGERDRDLIMELGVYEELTLYSVVALSNMLEEPEPAIWQLAKQTRGWGRIQAVRRLANPKSAGVRSWLLTDAHRNAVMAEEIAYFCAVQGRLLQALLDEFPSEALLDGAGELLMALVNGGPAEDMNDYADGGEACRLYIEHVGSRPSDKLERFIQVRSLQAFVMDSDIFWEALQPKGWTAENRWAVRTGAGEFLGRPEWRELVEIGLQSVQRQKFWPAAEAARTLNIDTWPHYFRRQSELKSSEWYFLMQTDDATRVSAVIDLALEQLDLEKVGSGPTSSLGVGPDYADDSAVDLILQDIRRFPGLGWPILEIGLRARTIRARNMAHRALEAWGRPNWPVAALPALRV